jgi:V/A-type H+/Na+-transporting ATPase subunit A
MIKEPVLPLTATGEVVKAFGNLLHVRFLRAIKQGEICMILLEKEMALKGEVIEIVGNVAKVQVFEDTRGVSISWDPG